MKKIVVVLFIFSIFFIYIYQQTSQERNSDLDYEKNDTHSNSIENSSYDINFFESVEQPISNSYVGKEYINYYPSPMYYSKNQIDCIVKTIFITDIHLLNENYPSKITCSEEALDYLAEVILDGIDGFQKIGNKSTYCYFLSYKSTGAKELDKNTAIYYDDGSVSYKFTDENTYEGDISLYCANNTIYIDENNQEYYEINLGYSHLLFVGYGFDGNGQPTKMTTKTIGQHISYAVYDDGSVSILSINQQ